MDGSDTSILSRFWVGQERGEVMCDYSVKNFRDIFQVIFDVKQALRGLTKCCQSDLLMPET